MEKCIFCDIAAGKASTYTLFENEHARAFLDIMPAAEGHALVIPKQHAKTLDELPGQAAKETIAVVQKVARAIVEATRADGYNVLQSNNPAAGQVVFHVHFHIIPRKHGDTLSFKWRHGTLAPKRGNELRDAIRNALE